MIDEINIKILSVVQELIPYVNTRARVENFKSKMFVSVHCHANECPSVTLDGRR